MNELIKLLDLTNSALFNEYTVEVLRAGVHMFSWANDLTKARKILVATVMRQAPCYYEQHFANNNYYGVGVDADGTVHGFGNAVEIEGMNVSELSLIDLSGLIENDDPDRLDLYEMRKRGKDEIQICLWQK